MNWHAVDAVDDAVEATRRFLFPFTPVRWTKLALLVLLMGGGVSANAPTPVIPGADASTTERFAPITDSWTVGVGAIDGGLIAAVTGGKIFTAIVVGAVLLVAAFSVLSLSLRLAFYDALHTNEVRLWRPFVSRLRQATGLFVVLTAMSVAAATSVAIAVLVGSDSATSVGLGPLDSLLAAIASLSTGPAVALGAVGAVFALLGVLAIRFTYEFVVPTMVVEDRGVIAGWKRVWQPLRRSKADVAAYLVVHFVIGVGISIFETLAVVFVGAAVVVTAGAVLLVVAGVLGGLGTLIGTTAGIASVVVVGAVALLMLLLLLLPIRTLTRTYLISYEVSTLGGIDRSLALLHPDVDPAAVTPDTQRQ